MKTVEQTISFIEGWERGIETGDNSLDADNVVLNTLKDLWAYIVSDDNIPS